MWRSHLDVLHNVDGKVALSSYYSDLINELYDDWDYIVGPTKLVHSVKEERTEVLWVNYDPAGALDNANLKNNNLQEKSLI